MSKRVLMAGYYGYGNVGDEGVLSSLLADLRAADLDLEFVATSTVPEVTAAAHNVQAVLWTDWPAVVQAVDDCDLLVLGGGGLLNSYLDYDPHQFLAQTSLFSVFIFGLPTLAHIRQTPVVICAVGASHINSEEAKRHVRWAVELSEACTVRDEGTRTILQSLGCPPDCMTVTADPVFRLQNAPRAHAERIFRDELDLPDKPVLGIVLRNWSIDLDPDRWIAAVADGLIAFAGREDLSLLFVPFQQSHDTPDDLSNDLSVIAQVREKVLRALPDQRCRVLADGHTPAEVSAVLDLCDAVLGMRLHSCVLSIKNGVPLVALIYEPKVRNILEKAGLAELGLDLRSVSSHQVDQALSRTWQNRQELSQRLQDAAVGLKDVAAGNIEMILRSLKGREPDQSVDRAMPPIGDRTEFFRWLAGQQTALLTQSNRDRDFLRELLRNLVNDGRHDLALPTIDALLATGEGDAELNYLGAYCLHRGSIRFDEALSRYESALSQGFDEFWVRYNRGSLHANLGSSREAIEDLARAVDLNPNHEDAQTLLRQVAGN